jgi:beta-galactosidase GanA
VAAAQNAASSLTSPGTTAANSAASKHAPGNLSVPDAQPAAQRVAHALNGKSHSRSIAGNQTGSHGSSFTRRP